MTHVSTVPIKPGLVNPSYGVVTDLMRSRDDFKDIAKKIVTLARQRFGKQALSPSEQAQFKEIVSRELAEEKKRWMSLVSDAVQHPPAPQVAPPPPPARELYGRIADGKSIVDVGSGNCFRLIADSGRLHITAIDPQVGDVKATIKKVQREVEVADVDGQFVTSHNALCQIPPSDVRTAILEQDGLHLLPDHDQLIDQGSASAIGDRVAVSTVDKVYLDYRVDGPSYPLSDGYKIMPRYQRRSIHFTASDDVSTWRSGDYHPRIDCSPCGPQDIDWTDMGWKWDGVPLEVEILSNGTAFITRRDGSYVEASAEGDVEQMSLHVEWLKEQGLMVLLRVECYRGMVPPHTGDLLRWFCDRVSLSWGGAVLVPPPVFDVSLGPLIAGVACPVDGIITRVRQRDFYVKPYWTVDLRPYDIRAVGDRVRDVGKTITADVREGLWEYRVHKTEENYHLEPVRRRDDKTVATTLGTVDYLLSLPTLKELVAVTGMSPEAGALASYFIEL